VRDDSGASAVEYGLIVGAIAAVVVAAAVGLGRVVEGTFSESCETIVGQVSVSSTC
jgi:pilus assembly protein Flp/PilA